jgi:hypothetical protein
MPWGSRSVLKTPVFRGDCPQQSPFFYGGQLEHMPGADGRSSLFATSCQTINRLSFIQTQHNKPMDI